MEDTVDDIGMPTMVEKEQLVNLTNHAPHVYMPARLESGTVLYIHY